jgi:hypothetical protein
MPIRSRFETCSETSGRSAEGSRALLAVVWRGLVVLVLVVTALAVGTRPASAEEAGPTQAERMAALGLIRYRGAWRTPQEVELVERNETANVAAKQWNAKLARLRQRLDQPATAAGAAEEIREISDPLAVAAVATALASEPVFEVRRAYVEALSHIRTPDAVATLIGTARDHPDRETRFAAVERLLVIGPHQAVSPIMAGLASADNAQVNRSAEALGRLGLPEAIGPLIAALETKHLTAGGGSQPAGSTSATFTPAGGGLSMGGGPKPTLVAVRNDRVLEALVALTGQNFEWDAAAWRAWLINERALPADFDPRRS